MCDEQEFIELLKQGNEEAFKKLIHNYKDLILKTAISFVPFYEDAEDITQEVFLEVYQSIRYFKMKSSLSTWIYRITVNKSINQLKKNKRYYEKQDINNFVDLLENDEEPSKVIEYKQLQKKIFHAIEELPKRQKIAFVLHKIEGKQYKEIAEIMNVSVSSVESLIHRAKIKLQKILEKQR